MQMCMKIMIGSNIDDFYFVGIHIMIDSNNLDLFSYFCY